MGAPKAGATGCCGGGCRRKQPPMVMRSELTGTWWVVLRYKDLGDGHYEALDKHLLAADSADQLEAWYTLMTAEAQDCVHCDGTGWVQDEGWTPPIQPWDGTRTEGNGLISCGACS